MKKCYWSRVASSAAAVAAAAAVWSREIPQPIKAVCSNSQEMTNAVIAVRCDDGLLKTLAFLRSWLRINTSIRKRDCRIGHLNVLKFKCDLDSVRWGEKTEEEERINDFLTWKRDMFVALLVKTTHATHIHIRYGPALTSANSLVRWKEGLWDFSESL